MQLQELNLSSNALLGSLPETWGNLTSVSPCHSLDLPMIVHVFCQGSLGLFAHLEN